MVVSSAIVSQLIAPQTTSVSSKLTVARFGGGSRSSQMLDRTLRVTVKPVIRAWRHAPNLPWPYTVVDHLGRVLNTEADLTRETFALPHCVGEMVRPAHRTGRVVVYLHGGAFLVGGLHLHRQIVSMIAHRTASTVLVPNYRKLPRHSVADAVADGVHAYELALKLAARPEDVVLVGDSAGGFMTFMVAVAAMRAGLPRPAGIAAMSPFVEFKPGLRRAGHHERTTCSVFPAGTLRTFSKVANRAHSRSPHRNNPLESLFDCDLTGLPETLIQASSSELLYPDICRIAALIGHEGVPVELQIWDHQAHVFQAAHRIVPEAAEAMGHLIDFVHRVSPTGHLSVVRA